jgi:hypothetical protein
VALWVTTCCQVKSTRHACELQVALPAKNSAVACTSVARTFTAVCALALVRAWAWPGYRLLALGRLQSRRGLRR